MSWELTGNAGTNPTANFLGTTDNEPLIIKTNGTEQLRIDVAGNVGIGATTPGASLEVAGTGAKFSGTLATETHTDANLYAGVFASTPRIIFGGSTTTHEIDNDGGLLRFFRPGLVDMVIDSSGNVGIGTTFPTSPLHIENGTAAKITLGKTGALAHTSTIYDDGNLHVEGNGQNIWINAASSATLILNNGGGNVGIGTTTPSEKLTINGNVSVTGDVILTGADCAEEFDIAEATNIEPGTVIVLDRDGVLHQSHQAYDKRVAGVISGAGDYQPGLILDRRQAQDNRMPVALVGKVYCKVDAQYAPIEVGDLLTTSPTPGHAMKADDPLKAFGAVIGKALCPLQAGQGMIPILIALQ